MKFSTILLASSAILSGVSARVIWTDDELSDICWRVCWPFEPKCPDGWVRKEIPWIYYEEHKVANNSHIQHAKNQGVSLDFTSLTPHIISLENCWHCLDTWPSLLDLLQVLTLITARTAWIDGLKSDDYLVSFSPAWREYNLISAGN
jgi:hypothetical protein